MVYFIISSFLLGIALYASITGAQLIVIGLIICNNEDEGKDELQTKEIISTNNKWALIIAFAWAAFYLSTLLTQ